jgi:hypothetical protein
MGFLVLLKRQLVFPVIPRHEIMTGLLVSFDDSVSNRGDVRDFFVLKRQSVFRPYLVRRRGILPVIAYAHDSAFDRATIDNGLKLEDKCATIRYDKATERRFGIGIRMAYQGEARVPLEWTNYGSERGV